MGPSAVSNNRSQEAQIDRETRSSQPSLQETPQSDGMTSTSAKCVINKTKDNCDIKEQPQKHDDCIKLDTDMNKTLSKTENNNEEDQGAPAKKSEIDSKQICYNCNKI